MSPSSRKQEQLPLCSWLHFYASSYKTVLQSWKLSHLKYPSTQPAPWWVTGSPLHLLERSPSPCPCQARGAGNQPSLHLLPFSPGNLVAKLVVNCKKAPANTATWTFVLTSPVWLCIVSVWCYMPCDDHLKGKKDLLSAFLLLAECWLQTSSCHVKCTS